MVAGVLLFWWLGIAIHIVPTTSIVIKQTFLTEWMCEEVILRQQAFRDGVGRGFAPVLIYGGGV